MKKNYYIYLTTNLINNKKYIGQHYGKINDNYLGSGVLLTKAISKYGKDNFKKEILKVCQNADELNYWEKYYITYFDAVNNDEYYNLAEGGINSDSFKNWNKYLKEHPEEAKEFYQKNYQKLQKWKEKHPEEYYNKIIIPLIESSKKWRNKHQEEVQEHMKKVNQRKEEWQKQHPEEHQKQVDKWRQAGSIANSQQILCITTGEIFESQCEAARHYNIQQGNISKCLKGERKSAGKHPETGEKLYWKLIEN